MKKIHELIFEVDNYLDLVKVVKEKIPQSEIISEYLEVKNTTKSVGFHGNSAYLESLTDFMTDGSKMLLKLI